MKYKSAVLLLIISALSFTVSAQKKRKHWLHDKTVQVKKIFSKKNKKTQPVLRPAPHSTQQPHVF